MIKEEILVEYTQKSQIYEEYTKRLESLLSAILEEKSIRVHSISSRLKEQLSLEKKIDKNTGKYRHLDDITDISGIRITTYFEDDVDKIAKIIEEEFLIDKNNSIDKRELIDPDRFGYLSLHYVASLNQSRSSLPEYKKFIGFKAEFQIRSILQHAWAEIEHDLGYKNQNSIPKSIKRSFSRLAGLLELADKEFIEIRTKLEKYQSNINEQINSVPEQVAIDRVSLFAYLKNNQQVKSINNQIATVLKVTKIYEDEENSLDDDIARLHFCGINTIDELSQVLISHEKEIVAFAHAWLNREGRETEEYTSIPNSIAVFYLTYVLAGSSDRNNVYKLLNCGRVGVGLEHERDDIAKGIFAACRQVAASK